MTIESIKALTSTSCADQATVNNCCSRSVEHAFRGLKRQFDFLKVRYRGLNKNAQHLQTLFVLSNLWMVREQLMSGQELVRLKTQGCL